MTKPADEPDPEGGPPADDPAGSRLSDEEYFARIEEHFGRRRGGPLVLSPKDWQLVERWYSEGVPVAVVLRGINRAFDRFRHSGPRSDRINSLRYCRQHVEETWEEHRDARAARRRDDDGAATEEAVEHLGAAAEACRAAAGTADHEDARAALSRVADELEGLARRVGQGEIGPRRIDEEARVLEEMLEAELASSSVPLPPEGRSEVEGRDEADEEPTEGRAISRRETLGLPTFSPYGV